MFFINLYSIERLIMSLLNETQLATLHADILAHPENDGLDDIQLAAYYNAPNTQGYVVWKSKVTQDEIMQNGMDWTRVDNLTVGKSRIWEWMFSNAFRTINPSKANVRAGIDATWVGTAADLAVRAAVYVHCKRLATRLEKLYATGTGSDVSPGSLIVEGQISYGEVNTAR